MHKCTNIFIVMAPYVVCWLSHCVQSTQWPSDRLQNLQTTSHTATDVCWSVVSTFPRISRNTSGVVGRAPSRRSGCGHFFALPPPGATTHSPSSDNPRLLLLFPSRCRPRRRTWSSSSICHLTAYVRGLDDPQMMHRRFAREMHDDARSGMDGGRIKKFRVALARKYDSAPRRRHVSPRASDRKTLGVHKRGRNNFPASSICYMRRVLLTQDRTPLPVWDVDFGDSKMAKIVYVRSWLTSRVLVKNLKPETPENAGCGTCASVLSIDWLIVRWIFWFINQFIDRSNEFLLFTEWKNW